MIGQGRISEIISQKSEDRRIIFEEAAGISKYRYQKQDAEKRLNEAETYLERAQDLLAELHGRIGPLEKDAAKAKVYLELYEEKKSLDIGLAVYDLSTITSRREVAEKDYVVVSRELEILDDTITSLEKREEAIYQEKLSVQAEYEEAMQHEGDLASRFSSIHSDLMVNRTRLEHLKQTLSDLADTYRLTESQISEKNTEISKLQDEEQRKSSELEMQKVAYAQTEAALESARLESISTQQCYDSLQLKKDQINQKLTSIRIELSALEAAKSTGASRLEEYAAQIIAAKSRLSELGEKNSVAKDNLKLYEEKRNEKQSQLDALRTSTTKIRSDRERTLQEINRISGEISARQQRINVLRRMEEHFEGYNRSVRFVAEAAKNGRLSGICGPLSQLISVDRPYALAIETALGNNLQNMVVENEAAAKAAIALLKRENAGRTTLYPLTSVKGYGFNGDLNALSAEPGYIGLASYLVRFDSRYNGIISYLLGRTLIFDTLDNATNCAKAYGYRHRIVTLDGQIVNSGGYFTGGSATKESGMLTRAAEIEEIATQQKDLEQKLTNLKSQYNRLEDSIEESEKEVEALSGELSLISVLYNSEKSNLTMLDTRIREESANLQSLTNASGRLDEVEAEKFAEAAALCAEESKLNGELEAINVEIQNTMLEKNRTANLLDSKISEKNTALVTISIQTKELERIAERIEESKAQINKLSDDLLRYTDRQNTAIVEQKALIARIEENETLASSLNDEIGNMKSKGKSLTERSLELEKQTNAIRQSSREKAGERERLVRSCTNLESVLERINAEQDNLTERLWEDYELTYAEAMEKVVNPITPENRSASISRQNKLKSKIRELGNVNVGAVEEYKSVKERYETTNAQVQDLLNSKQKFTEIITKLETQMCQRFSDTFERVNVHFKEVFSQLFGGGNANLSLSDPANVLTSGIEIEVAPPGKIIKNLKLLSGGEQVFVAIAIFFAILKVNPAPFCLLDEIESALDEVNVDRFAAYARMFSDNTQFIIITHRRGSMEAADTLYGVTMQEKGISKVLSMNVNEVEQKLGVKL
jgi:chromosome segregation protein